MRRLAALAATVSILALGAVGAAPAMAATQDMCSGSSSNGTESVVWDIAYDTTAQTVDLTATGQATSLVLSVTLVSTQQTASLDATSYLNAGTVVLVGPGSVLGFNQKVKATDIPVVSKGQPYPFTCSSTWVP